MKPLLSTMLLLLIACPVVLADNAQPAAPPIAPLVRTVDLDVGQETSVTLCDGTKVRVKLLEVIERRDPVRNALREATVCVAVDGLPVALTSCTYNLPRTFGTVQIDCPITKGYVDRANVGNAWSLERDARLRLWPKDSPWIRPGTFGYPVNQRWFADQTQMSNELADNERVENKKYYYHYGLDFGGTERLADVLSATAGTVVSVAGKLLGKKPYPKMLKPRADVVYLRDGRGWYYRYSHLDSIDPAITLGARVKLGQRIGALGKKGASGGWTHLHLDLISPQPSGRYGIDDAYAFVWQAYQRQHPTPLVAVARPHELAYVGDPVVLDGSRSYSADGSEGLRYEWVLTDGTTIPGAKTFHRYAQPGSYSEILKVTDSSGRVGYDFARIVVRSRKNPRQRSPIVHATYWPTLGLEAGQSITFTVITREIANGDGHEVWDFGDGSPTVVTQSKSNPYTYAVTSHVYEKPGTYLVRVDRENHRGEKGTARLVVRVGSNERE